ncbi:MAG TPA: hypothetical protein VGB37_14090 [Candidatus Lokiarchaeia archaeon]
MKKFYNLKLRELYSESLLRDLILFFFLFFLVLAQNWDNILLLLFPIVSFCFGVFFKTIDIIKKRSEIDIVYNPIGYEKIHANRLILCSLLQLILLFWYGAESFYHPQLIDDYYTYFMVIFAFLYSFGFYWIFLDLWRYSRIELIFQNINLDEIQRYSGNFDNILSFLKVKNFKIISLVNFIAFISLNALSILFSLLIFYDIMPGFKYNLPGTVSENSEPITLSVLVYFILTIPPSISIFFLILIYKNILDIDKNKFNTVLQTIPKESQNKVVENLIALNKKLKVKLSLE